MLNLLYKYKIIKINVKLIANFGLVNSINPGCPIRGQSKDPTCFFVSENLPQDSRKRRIVDSYSILE